MTAETPELTFSNQLDKFFAKPQQSSASRKSAWTEVVLPIPKSHAVLQTSLKDVFANLNNHDKNPCYPWTRALQTAWPHTTWWLEHGPKRSRYELCQRNVLF